MTIVLRSVKGSNLTPAEVDGNFTDLDGRVTAIENDPPSPVEIVDFVVVGSQFTVEMSDSSVLGPYQLPVAVIEDRGEYVAGTDYVAMDAFSVEDVGIFLVLRDHEAPTEFDENHFADGFQAYLKIFGVPTMHDLAVFVPGKPGEGLNVDSSLFAHVAVRPFYFPADLTGSQAFLEIAPTDPIAFKMFKAEAGTFVYEEIGSIDFAGATNAATFTFPNDIQMGIGDRFFISPSIQDLTEDQVYVDTTAEDLMVSIKAIRGTIPATA